MVLPEFFLYASYGCSGIVPYILLDHLWEFLSNAMKASQLGLLEAGKAEMCTLGPVRTKTP
jgi:hypothetical protein